MFITFEGIEGCGKSTQTEFLRDYLEGLGYSVLVTLEPGGSRLGVELRRMLLSLESDDLTREAELFLYLADRAQHVHQVIRPALEAGRIVISDRFTHSTLAYQGYGREMGVDALQEMNIMAVDGTVPDITFLLDLPPETGLRRALGRNMEKNLTSSEGRFEAEALEFHVRVRQGYLELASRKKEKIVVLDAQALPETVFQGVVGKVNEIMKIDKKCVDNANCKV
ncbi:thymidylate kinase [Desulfonatronospira thiodismutans ASO3-1]|uniref:Thymidylate kinase n=1 Tax=Desulfonatronospira thiodismutans ASO3-1 TaxID=555779 RepID=D6SSW0_9BACT|nr:dTMP kinase [Desulfonatronospira thiodismutans]EFI33776.1 thymidylate kinase [Desulfonatronospira thiodismutans ASO3-1]